MSRFVWTCACSGRPSSPASPNKNLSLLTRVIWSCPFVWAKWCTERISIVTKSFRTCFLRLYQSFKHRELLGRNMVLWFKKVSHSPEQKTRWFCTHMPGPKAWKFSFLCGYSWGILSTQSGYSAHIIWHLKASCSALVPPKRSSSMWVLMLRCAHLIPKIHELVLMGSEWSEICPSSKPWQL